MSQDPTMYNQQYPPQQPGGYAGYPPQQPMGYGGYPPQQPGGYPPQQPAGYGQSQMPFQPPPVVPRPDYPKGLFFFLWLELLKICWKDSEYRSVPQHVKGMIDNMIFIALMLVWYSLEWIINL